MDHKYPPGSEAPAPTPQRKVLDSHIHLWPETATSSKDHGWMTSGHHLAKVHGITQYKAASLSQSQAFIYVETDRYLPGPAPNIPPKADSLEHKEQLCKWAQEPLQESLFLRRMVKDAALHGDGFEPGDGAKMAGCVLWAPFHLPSTLFDMYLEQVKLNMEDTWGKVVGFRYLLQGPRSADIAHLLRSEHWFANLLKLRTGRGNAGWAFDVGVDTHRDGVETLEHIVTMVQKTRLLEGGDGSSAHIRFIINHLGKPDLSTTAGEEKLASWSSPLWPAFPRWKAALEALGQDPDVYIKLSGALNEFEPEPTPADAGQILDRLRPFLELVHGAFGERVMFGSDWPVCNVGGPSGEKSWAVWYEVVERWVGERKLGEGVWFRAAEEAYGVRL